MNSTDQIIHAAAVEIAGELEPPKYWIPKNAVVNLNAAAEMIEPIIRKCCQDFHKEILRKVEQEAANIPPPYYISDDDKTNP